MEEVRYTKAEVDRAISNMYDDLNIKFEQRLKEIEVQAELEGRKKFEPDFKDLENQKNELNAKVLEDYKKLLNGGKYND